MNERQGYIMRMIALAATEPGEFHEPGETLIGRALQYAGSARPRVTVAEVEEVLELMKHLGNS